MAPFNDLVTVSEASHMLGISRQAVYGLLKSGALAATTLTINNRRILAIRRRMIETLLNDEIYAKLTRRRDRETFLNSVRKASDTTNTTNTERQNATP